MNDTMNLSIVTPNGEIFNSDIDSKEFREFATNGTIRNGFANFQCSVWNGDYYFTIDDGKFNTYRDEFSFKSSVNLNDEKLGDISYSSLNGNKILVEPTTYGKTMFKLSLEKIENSEYKSELKSLTERLTL